MTGTLLKGTSFSKLLKILSLTIRNIDADEFDSIHYIQNDFFLIGTLLLVKFSKSFKYSTTKMENGGLFQKKEKKNDTVH